MPEEINRVLTDQVADLLFTPSADADGNLSREGIDSGKIHRVGNVMIDTLVRMLPRASQGPILERLGVQRGRFLLVTLHRPSNVDDPVQLRDILRALERASKSLPVVFPVHPRTRLQIGHLGYGPLPNRLALIEPLGYLDFLGLMQAARMVLTDSGGVQEETTFLGIPCLTARPNTERPITIQMGTNRLVPTRCEDLVAAIAGRLDEPQVERRIPPLWDGLAARRIADVLEGLP
jgi:UDP-N-acetylglucosamine 2-epimerase (non-hydrolysing)